MHAVQLRMHYDMDSNGRKSHTVLCSSSWTLKLQPRGEFFGVTERLGHNRRTRPI